MSTPRSGSIEAAVIASLYIEALRQGQSLWFRVISGSMRPLLRVGDSVYIEAAGANALQPGEIAAFETSEGLIIHRIVKTRVQNAEERRELQLLEIGDVELRARWIAEQAVVGRVVTIRRATQQIDLRHPIAQKCGKGIAFARYRLYSIYLSSHFPVIRVSAHKCARLLSRIGYWCIRASRATTTYAGAQKEEV